MKYFTPELYVRLQARDDHEIEAADADWERAVDAYDRRLKKLWSSLPATARTLIDDYYLHDAEVIELAREGDAFVVVLRLEPPPNQLMVLNYSLTTDPIIHQQALPAELCSSVTQWMYDELDVVPRKKQFTHSILLSNGWELRLAFRDLQVVAANGLLSGSRARRLPRPSAAQTV